MKASDGPLCQSSGARRGLANASHPLVGIARLGVQTICFDILEGGVKISTLATQLATRVAIHELLLAERHKLLGGNLVRSLEGPRGGEGPARPARALVFHR